MSKRPASNGVFTSSFEGDHRYRKEPRLLDGGSKPGGLLGNGGNPIFGGSSTFGGSSSSSSKPGGGGFSNTGGFSSNTGGFSSRTGGFSTSTGRGFNLTNDNLTNNNDTGYLAAATNPRGLGSNNMSSVDKNSNLDDTNLSEKKLPDDEFPDELDEDEILKMLEEADGKEIEILTSASLKKMIAQLDQKTKQNMEMRLKFANNPEEYLDSEVELNDHILTMKDLNVAPELYGEFVKFGGVGKLVNGLIHTNTDITLCVLDVLQNLTAAEVIQEVDEPAKFVEALFEANLGEMYIK